MGLSFSLPSPKIRYDAWREVVLAEPPSRAAQQVLDTNELLELILLHMSMADVLRWERVSKHTNQLIKTSLRLQQHLYRVALDPDSAKDVGFNHTVAGHLLQNHELVCHAGSPVYGQRIELDEDSMRMLPDLYLCACKARPKSHMSMLCMIFESAPCDKDPEAVLVSMLCLLSGEASWLDMLVTQPPAPPRMLMVKRPLHGACYYLNDWPHDLTWRRLLEVAVKGYRQWLALPRPSPQLDEYSQRIVFQDGQWWRDTGTSTIALCHTPDGELPL